MSDRSDNPNQQLARRIGEALERGSLERVAEDARGDDAADPLLSTVLAYRRSVDAEAPDPSPETSARMWDRIEARMDAAEAASADRSPATQAPPRPAREPDRSPQAPGGKDPRTARFRTLWRVAAGVAALLIAGVVTWWALQPPQAQLVARAETSMATVETDDGSTVRLRPHSELYRVETTEDGTDRYRLEGEALFDVVTDPSRAFEVQANGARVRVLGTRFTVRTWTPDPEVFLDEGRVELMRGTGGSPVVLQPGQRGVVRSDAIDVDAAPSAAYLDWTERRLAMDARTAAQVAAELGQHYNVRLSLPDSVAEETLTGRLLLEDRRQALRDFGAVLGGRFTESGDRQFVFRPERGSNR